VKIKNTLSIRDDPRSNKSLPTIALNDVGSLRQSLSRGVQRWTPFLYCITLKAKNAIWESSGLVLRYPQNSRTIAPFDRSKTRQTRAQVTRTYSVNDMPPADSSLIRHCSFSRAISYDFTCALVGGCVYHPSAKNFGKAELNETRDRKSNYACLVSTNLITIESTFTHPRYSINVR